MKLMNIARKYGQKVAVGSVALVPMVSMAAGPDFTSVTAAVDWSTVVTGVLAVAALVAAVYVAIRGAKMLIGMIRS
ncbi:hypothetical protein D9M68_947860 [compost metagenome]